MILYNVTIKVEPPIAEEWLNWIKNEHVPEVINTGCFVRANVYRLLEVDNSEGPTFCVQYFAENRSLYDQYIETFATEMREKSFQKWGDRFIAFRSVMEFVN